VQSLPSLHDPVCGVWKHPLCGLQASVVQPLPSSQTTEVPPHTPLLQASPVVHTLWSSQALPVRGAWPHPVPVSQTSDVHGSPSLQSTGIPWQVPPLLQRSFAVQALPSLQAPVIGVCWHPAVESQVSRVQGLLSSQLTSVWLHWCVPLSHASVVQIFASSQIAAVHPVEQAVLVRGCPLVPTPSESSCFPLKLRCR